VLFFEDQSELNELALTPLLLLSGEGLTTLSLLPPSSAPPRSPMEDVIDEITNTYASYAIMFPIFSDQSSGILQVSAPLVVNRRAQLRSVDASRLIPRLVFLDSCRETFGLSSPPRVSEHLFNTWVSA